MQEFVAYVDRGNDPSIALMKALGFEPVAYDDPDKQLFAWRRDATPFPADWEPPVVPRY